MKNISIINFLLLPVLLFAGQFTFSQNRKVVVPDSPLDSLNDDFSSSASLNQWTWFHQAEKFPDKVKATEVKEGLLNLQSYSSGWYADWQAPFLFKNVTGNFDIRMKIKVSGLTASLPQTEWSLAGLMVRQAKQTTIENWEPRQENWLFLTTGVAEPLGTPMFEAKTTTNSISNLKLRPAREGWVELRIVRIHASFILMYRYENEAWTVLERMYRPLLPPTVQVGINAYSGYKGVPHNVANTARGFNETVMKESTTDMLVQVDYVHFIRPKLNAEKFNSLMAPGFKAPYYLPGNLLTDYSLSNAELLQIIDGDR